MSLSVDVEPMETAGEEIAPTVAGRSLTQIAWSRLRRDKVAMTSLTMIIIVLLTAIFAPLILRVMSLDPYTGNTDLLNPAGGLPLGRFGGMSLSHPLGVEPQTGRDLLARLLYGARISLFISLSATILTVVFGVLIGTIAGYSRGWVDGAISRFVDLMLAFPLLLMVISLSTVITQRLSAMGLSDGQARVAYLILVLSLFGWPYLARIVRGQVLSLREREFVEASVSIGAGTRRILFKELIPNLWAPVIVYASLLLPSYIAAEATLSFLGVGVLPPTASWGAMLADSVSYFTVDPAYLFIPGTALFIVVLSFNLLGDAVRDALDPRAGRV